MSLSSQVTTQVFLLALITLIRTVRFPIAEMQRLNAEAVPAPPANSLVLVVEAVTTWRVRTVLAVSVLFLLLLSETFLVTNAVEDFLPAPGRTAGLFVEVEVVTAVARCYDSFIVSFRTVFLPVTNIVVSDKLFISSTRPT